MSMRNASKHRTICEVLREINDLHQGANEHDVMVRMKLAEAQAMAKRMSRKLLEYNKEVYRDWWEKNKDFEADLDRRLSKNYLVEGKEENENNQCRI